MKIRVLAIGTKMPAWVYDACDAYLKRFPREFSVEFVELAAAKRPKSYSVEKVKEQEGSTIAAAFAKQSHKIALDVKGTAWSTEALAEQWQAWQRLAMPVDLFIGGPDGLSQACLNLADQRWSISKLTLPHPLVRVVVVEQLYRAWSIAAHHPYHK